VQNEGKEKTQVTDEQGQSSRVTPQPDVDKKSAKKAFRPLSHFKEEFEGDLASPPVSPIKQESTRSPTVDGSQDVAIEGKKKRFGTFRKALRLRP